jgi:phosphoribosylformylglycinamidine (FGAM) synthase-like enzyme
VALAESGFAKGFGISVDLVSNGLSPEFVLFGEDASRVIISCDQSNLSRIQQLAVKYSLSADVIGQTVSDKVEIRLDGRVVVSASVKELRDGYEGAIEAALKADPELVS